MTKSGYDKIARFYDGVIGNSAAEIKYVKKHIKRYFPAAKSVLEPGCGTGNNLEELKKDYFVRGIDNSTMMLEIARKKVRNCEFVKSDILQYIAERKFDVVICMYDTVNHILKFNEWKKFFSSVNCNLNDNGLFIFDINTLKKLKFLSEISPIMNKTGKNYFIADIRKLSKHTYNWNLKIFEFRKMNNYLLHETDIMESSFEIDRIISVLSKYFNILKIEDENLRNFNTDSDRVYFFCRKKSYN